LAALAKSIACLIASLLAVLWECDGLRLPTPVARFAIFFNKNYLDLSLFYTKHATQSNKKRSYS
jgi:hypothetical protein